MWLLFSLGCSTLCKDCEAELSLTKRMYEECQNSYGTVVDINEDPSWDALVQSYFKETFGRELDSKLNEEIRTQTQLLFEESRSWDLSNDNKKLRGAVKWSQIIKQKDWDDETIEILRWAPFGAYLKSSKFVSKINSDEKLVCARGLMELSYRQATHLGLQAKPDAFYVGKKSKISSSKQRAHQLYRSLEASGIDESLWPEDYQEKGGSISSTLVPLQVSKRFCITQEGEDERNSLGRVSKAFDKLFQHKSLKGASTLGQVASIYAAELNEHNFTTKSYVSPISFKGRISRSLYEADVRGGDWVHKQVAKSIAKAIVAPCTLWLKGDESLKDRFFEEDEPPNTSLCTYMYWATQQEDF